MAIFKYFLLTLLLELPIMLLAYKWQQGKVLIIGILLNLLTWPIITLLYNSTHIPLLFMELCVCLIEGIGYKIFFNGKCYKALLVSFLANGCSLSVGWLICCTNFLYM